MASGSKERAFFDQYKGWVKHLVLKRYVERWARIVGSGSPRVWIVDCFAGAGSFPAPNGGTFEGSPLIAARAAVKYHNQFPSRRLEVLAIERNRMNFRDLENAVSSYSDVVSVRSGAFHQRQNWIIEKIGDDPALVLIDPIGLSPIPSAHLAPLLQRAGKTDVFINLQFLICQRATGLQLKGRARGDKIAANIDASFNTVEWRPIARDFSLDPLTRDREYLALYFDHVLGSRYPFKHAYAVRESVDGALRYWLVHAGAHEAAAWVMNDAVVDVEKELFTRPVVQEAARLPFLPGLAPDPAAAVHKAEAELAEDIVVLLRARGGVGSLRLVENQLVERYFGRVKRTAYARVIKVLVRQGVLVRTKDLRATVEPTERIWIERASTA